MKLCDVHHKVGGEWKERWRDGQTGDVVVYLEDDEGTELLAREQRF